MRLYHWTPKVERRLWAVECPICREALASGVAFYGGEALTFDNGLLLAGGVGLRAGSCPLCFKSPASLTAKELRGLNMALRQRMPTGFERRDFEARCASCEEVLAAGQFIAREDFAPKLHPDRTIDLGSVLLLKGVCPFCGHDHSIGA